MRDLQKATPGGSGQAVAERNTEDTQMVAVVACLDKPFGRALELLP